jgi:hypothetical protein
MKRWLRRVVIAAALIAIGAAVIFESCTRVVRGWWQGEPFYDGRPASFWADEIECWETKNPAWETQIYVRRSGLPSWAERMLPEPRWPQLLDGDRSALIVLQALRKHPSENVKDWARIGIERLDNEERGPIKIKHPSVILIASLHEVEPALYDEIAKGKWRSSAELEKMERDFLHGIPLADGSLFDLLDKQKVLLPAKEIKLELGKEGTLLAVTKQITCRPSPVQLRKGHQGPQTLEEGMLLSAHADISFDRRYLRLMFSEKISSIEGIDKVTVILDNSGTTAIGEIAAFKETTFKTTRNLPDTATFLLPLQHRSDDAEKAKRGWVARISARIYIEAEERQMEERQIRGAAKK